MVVVVVVVAVKIKSEKINRIICRKGGLKCQMQAGEERRNDKGREE